MKKIAERIFHLQARDKVGRGQQTARWQGGALELADLGENCAAALASCGNCTEAVHYFAHAGKFSLVLSKLLRREGACGGLAFGLVAIGGEQTFGLSDTGLVV